MTAKISTRSNFTVFAKYLKEKEAFRTHGALRGTDQRPDPSTYPFRGLLEGKDLEMFSHDWEHITYVVYSYDTPIAWFTEDWGWYQVEQKFSPTTSTHQSKITTAIRVIQNES